MGSTESWEGATNQVASNERGIRRTASTTRLASVCLIGDLISHGYFFSGFPTSMLLPFATRADNFDSLILCRAFSDN